MNELHRVLKPNGLAALIFPHFPNKTAFIDPTHVNFIPKQAVSYFAGTKEGPFYAGILTSYSVLLNSRLRIWSPWFGKPNLGLNLSFRRKLSLMRRTIGRFFLPTHTIWVLKKL